LKVDNVCAGEGTSGERSGAVLGEPHLVVHEVREGETGLGARVARNCVGELAGVCRGVGIGEGNGVRPGVR
jgi:hypothetical protein